MENIEKQILEEILKSTFTVDNFKKRYLVLKLLLEKKIYKTSLPAYAVKRSLGSDDPRSDDEKQEEKPDPDLIGAEGVKSGSLEKHKAWAEKFDQKLMDQVTNENFKSLNEYINKFIEGGAVLSIYFVFIPDQAQVEEIGNWLRKSLNKPNLIFDVKVDPGLIGGCAVAYKGVYKDYSLKARIAGSKEQLIGEFRKYFKQ